MNRSRKREIRETVRKLAASVVANVKIDQKLLTAEEFEYAEAFVKDLAASIDYKAEAKEVVE